MGAESPVGALEQKVMTVAPVKGSMARCMESGRAMRWYQRARETVESEVPSEIMRMRFFTGLGRGVSLNARNGERSKKRATISVAELPMRKAFI